MILSFGRPPRWYLPNTHEGVYTCTWSSITRRWPYFPAEEEIVWIYIYRFNLWPYILHQFSASHGTSGREVVQYLSWPICKPSTLQLYLRLMGILYIRWPHQWIMILEQGRELIVAFAMWLKFERMVLYLFHEKWLWKWFYLLHFWDGCPQCLRCSDVGK